jgi:hypothetical protein
MCCANLLYQVVGEFKPSEFYLHLMSYHISSFDDVATFLK